MMFLPSLPSCHHQTKCMNKTLPLKPHPDMSHRKGRPGRYGEDVAAQESSIDTAILPLPNTSTTTNDARTEKKTGRDNMNDITAAASVLQKETINDRKKLVTKKKRSKKTSAEARKKMNDMDTTAITAATTQGQIHQDRNMNIMTDCKKPPSCNQAASSHNDPIEKKSNGKKKTIKRKRRQLHEPEDQEDFDGYLPDNKKKSDRTTAAAASWREGRQRRQMYESDDDVVDVYPPDENDDDTVPGAVHVGNRRTNDGGDGQFDNLYSATGDTTGEDLLQQAPTNGNIIVEDADQMIISAQVVPNMDQELAMNQGQLAELRRQMAGAGQAQVMPAEGDEQHKDTGSCLRSRTYFWSSVVTLVLVVVAVAGVLAGVFLSRGKEGGGGGGDVGKSTPVPSQFLAATSAPGSAPSSAPSSAPLVSRLELFRTIVQDISSAESLSDEESAQYQAFNWVANEDLAMLDPEQDIVEIEERYVLAVLYYSTGGPLWDDQHDFLSFRSVCAWNSGNTLGVYCNDDQRIFDMDISFHLFRGTMPSELGRLTNLESLRFFFHNGYLDEGFDPSIALTGTIPSTLGQLTKLTYLDFRGNHLTGNIPSELGLLTNLRYLSVASNELTGQVPTEIASLPDLDHFRVNFNDGIFGNLDPFFCDRDPLIETFTSDCPTRITCSCCTSCFGD